MTFALASLMPIAGALDATVNSAPRLWSFVTADNIADLDSANYFDGAVDRLKVGDFIFAKCTDGGGIYYVNANDGTHVDCGNVTQIGGTDSD